MDDEAIAARLQEVWRQHVIGDPRAQLSQWREREPDGEHRLTVPTPSSKRLLILLCARYGLKPYRRPRMRASSACVDAPEGFVQEVLWPVFEAMAQTLDQEVDAMTARILERWSGSDGKP